MDGVHGDQNSWRWCLSREALFSWSGAGIEDGEPRDKEDLSNLEVVPVHAFVRVGEVLKRDVEFGRDGITGVAGLHGVGAWIGRGGGDGEHQTSGEEIPLAVGNVGVGGDEDGDGDVVRIGDGGGGVAREHSVRWHCDDGDLEKQDWTEGQKMAMVRLGEGTNEDLILTTYQNSSITLIYSISYFSCYGPFAPCEERFGQHRFAKSKDCILRCNMLVKLKRGATH